MTKFNIKGMDVSALIVLRDQVERALQGARELLERQLRQLGGSVRGKSGRPVATSRSSALKGKKAEPKYRDPDTGQTWAARGAQPRWLVAKLKGGAKLEDFAIGSASKKVAKSGGKRTKRGRPRKAA